MSRRYCGFGLHGFKFGGFRLHGFQQAALVLALVTGSLAASASAAEPSPAPAPRMVLLELFTSQGCSSCPPADRLLTELAAEGARGVEVIALSYHVDYWNYIGWTDPFSSAEWSDRQRDYSRQLAGSRTYTPQLVVDGVSECVGSNRRQVANQVADAAERAPGAVLAASHAADGRLAITASLPALAAGPARVQVAIFETGLATEVKSGENARRTLHNDNVVRRLTTVAELAPGQEWSGDHGLEIDPSWRADRLGVAIFVQSVSTLEVLAATAERL